jgi:2-polyprenyl-3-methyl-5-hydroxy-6-metoxy-1,4-benzoquinol methylase
LKNKICPVCGSSLRAGVNSWHYICRSCKYEHGDLTHSINKNNQVIDEDLRASGLKSLRMSNFSILLDRIKKHKLSGRLLDVGCAHGWFIDKAKNLFDVSGLEPDLEIFNLTSSMGLNIKNGYFPEALDADEKFDLIIFNDVIEHIPNMGMTLEACRNHLNSRGVLILNLPSSSGFFYRTSKFLHLIGIESFFERLWQKDFPSPHLHYFNFSNLNTLLLKYGFSIKEEGYLPSLGSKGLFTRIKYAKQLGFFSAVVIYCLVLLITPILYLLPSDISYVIAFKDE